MSDLVTGDAVVLGLRPARLPSRALAILLDLCVYITGYLLLSIGLAVATASLDDAAVAAVSVASFILVLVGVPIAVETLSRGRSLGKLACGLRVVRDDGGPIRFRHALVRGAMGTVELLGTFGTVAVISSLVSENGRRLGDVFGGTLVVRERVPAARVMPVPPPPPWLAGRFTGLDLSAVPDGLWLAIRQYLTRMGQLDPQIGAAMAVKLADDLVAKTGTPPPAGVPAAAYLAAVVHERQTRDAARAFSSAPGQQPPHAGYQYPGHAPQHPQGQQPHQGYGAHGQPAAYPAPYPGPGPAPVQVPVAAPAPAPAQAAPVPPASGGFAPPS
ncbi:RDD family protein [Streptomyces sp. NPDC090022]|uniref:RDD family protein n=1 Tax=Streptomyces sp. NPDC090022 TaxID=3365920 RepID=UPI0037F46BCA